MSDRVIEIVPASHLPSSEVITALSLDELLALRVPALIAPECCIHLTNAICASPALVPHADVPGLSVLGFSHFQYARSEAVRPTYLKQHIFLPSELRKLSHPFPSPFGEALALLAAIWPSGVRLLRLPSEGNLSPFTIRVYGQGVGIEPHLDHLAAESPGEPEAMNLTAQFGANLYISVPERGGELELFDLDLSRSGYSDLDSGPKTYQTDALGPPTLTIAPRLGELILFSSRNVHRVSANRDPTPRITLSFFVGLRTPSDPIDIWA